MNNKLIFSLPSPDCPLCPRLAAFRGSNRRQYKDFFNAPVPSFGALDAQLLVVGLAPGLKGANRTGRPFTGDYAGLVLYAALKKYGFAAGEYDPEKVIGFRLQGTALKPDTCNLKPSSDNLQLLNCRITNAVRCVPPENKPEPAEIRQCNGFLASEITAMPNLKIILTLGQIAHKAVLMALGLKQSAYAFAHGAEHPLQPATCNLQPILLNSYHCSRYNINTRVLTQAMFDAVVERAKERIG